ncbi:MAG: aminotransferase class IV [Bilophila sp.]
MIPVLNTEDWLARLQRVERPGTGVLAFYEHRFGAICRDPRLMLAPLDDHLVHRGDGVFETIRFTERKVIHIDAHLKRLGSSAEGLSIPLPCPLNKIREIILAVAHAGDAPEGNLRVLVGRGPGGFGIAPSECPEPSLYIAAYKVAAHTDAWYNHGLTAFRSDVPVKPPMLARLKTTNYLSGVLMTLEAMRKGMDVALSFDTDNCLTEAAIANVGIVDAAGTFVLPEFRNALVGTVATKAMELARDFMPVAIRRIPQTELASIKEMMILGTAHECVGVTHFDGIPVGNGTTGPVAHKLRTLLHDVLLADGEPF